MLVGTVSDDQMKSNVIENMKLAREWLIEKEPHDGVALICGAGPSLLDTLPDIKAKKGTIFASNSAAGFLHNHGIEPDYQVLLDAHIRTLDEIGPAKNHLLASTVSPIAFERLPKAILWHPSTLWIDDFVPENRDFTFIGGGITVTNSSICIAYTLGFREIHCYGMDSSHRETTHATEQPDIESLMLMSVEVESLGKTYKTTYDLKQQVLVFNELYKLLMEAECKVIVHGSGLLPDLYTSTT